MKLPHGHATRAAKLGSVRLTNTFVLHNALHVPAFESNLLSVSKFAKDHSCFVTFYPHFCLFQDLWSGKTMGIGEERNDLYYLDLTRFCFHSADSNKGLDLAPKSWSSIIILYARYLLFLRHLHYLTVIFAHNPNKPDCHFLHKPDCHSPFQIIHMDIWGPFHIATRNGEKYFLTIVDEYTKSTWIYLMHSKLDVLQMIKKFVALVHNQFSSSIEIVRTDNATDFFKSECTTFFNFLGVTHQSSCPYTPQ